MIHPNNLSPKKTNGREWKPFSVEKIRNLLEEERESSKNTAMQTKLVPLALVTAAAGIGDIIRTTPLIRVLHSLGFQVDVLLSPDYPESIELLRGAPEIRQLYLSQDTRVEQQANEYEVATFTGWSTPLIKQVKSKQNFTLPINEWRYLNYTSCIDKIARSIGWQQALPEPFSMTSNRQFNLPPGTIAVHPGCKSDWFWKKWHGFDELAWLFPNVVVIGSESDLDNRQTYFRESFVWPSHVKNYVGKLSLIDTAAMLKQCAGLVSNDSGLMHLGVALGIPTFGIFGLTSPKREAIPSRWMFPITKGLPCESFCRQKPWGRKDCELHLECLKTLTAEEVLSAMKVQIPTLTNSHSEPPAESIRPALRFALVFSGGIGDLIISSCLVYELYQLGERLKCDVFFHNPDAARFVFNGVSFVQRINDSRQLFSLQNQYDAVAYISQFVRFDIKHLDHFRQWEPALLTSIEEATFRLSQFRGLFDKQPQLDGFWGRLATKSGMDRVSGLGYFANLPISKQTEYLINPDASEYAFWLNTFGSQPVTYCTIHDGVDNNFRASQGAATKCWIYEHWVELVQLLKLRYPSLRIVQLGGQNSRPITGVDINLINKTNLNQVAWLIKQASFHIDGDSGLVHLAKAMHTKCIVMFGPTNLDFFGYSQNINIKPRECGDCWWETPTWLGECPRGLVEPACMKSILPREVLEVVESIFPSHPEPDRFEADSLTLYSRYLSIERAWQLTDIFKQLAMHPVPITEHAKENRSGLYIHASKQWEYLFVLQALEQRCNGLEKPLHIADLGGGRGALPAYLAKLGHTMEVYDINYLWDHGGDEWIEKRYMKWAKANGYAVRFGSLFNLPCTDNSYDVVTSISVVEHVQYKALAIKEAFRILKPGGLLIMTFDFSHKPEQLRDSLRVEIFGPDLLSETLSELGIHMPVVDAEIVQKSANDIQADGVLGIPQGMTVGGLVIKKLG
jgi:ADP-heptose:LPS heptosyltransferase/SAM-dependent methyltransferase